MAAWNPWKATALAMALVLATALVTGLVVANLTGSDTVSKAAEQATEQPRAAARPAAPAVPAAPALPTPGVIATCNEAAARETGPRDKTLEVVKDTAIGAVGGALYGLNENRRQDERYREAYARCLRARGYAG